ncbi:MAG TPA: dihydrolipoamide acetyltransferase family protein, partial [Acidimicrobiales bacterium]|nr:dihydrolipoamide acetyltransferase family protein [Acidimicrobiales bacterium]
MAEITMPQLGETVTEGTITKWHKQVGDQVAEDDVLFEVSTDKVDSEVPSPVSGVLSEILVPEGDTVDVGTRLAVISDGGGATTPAPAPAVATAPPAAAETAAPAAAAATETEPAAPPETATPAVPAAEAAPAGPREPAPVERVSVAAVPSPAVASVPAATGAEPDGGEAGGAGRVLSPVVRRLIAEHQLDPAQIQGTGAGGRITRNDVLALIDRRNGGAAVASPAGGPAPLTALAPPPVSAPAAPPPAPAGAPPVATLPAGEHDTVVPFTNIRRRTAEHMVRSKATSAHTMVAVEVDYSGVDVVRAAEKDRFREAEGFGLTYLPFVTRAVVDALAEFPNVNSSVGDDTLNVHHDINIGIAVDLDFEGLLVPVIHEADGKRLRSLAREISGLASKARSKRLTMDDISGGTFTITNAGPFGSFITVPVINQPQVAILSTDGVRKRPVVVELPDGSDAIAIHPVGNLVMSWDHRAF